MLWVLFGRLSPDATFARTTSTGTESYLTDGWNSTIGLASSAAKVETTYTYEPFGGTAREGATSENPYQYSGREDDGDGLYYSARGITVRGFEVHQSRSIGDSCEWAEPLPLRGGLVPQTQMSHLAPHTGKVRRKKNIGKK
jgi:hypothetical protein